MLCLRSIRLEAKLANKALSIDPVASESGQSPLYVRIFAESFLYCIHLDNLCAVGIKRLAGAYAV